jgi:YHS domain-containing protein
MIRAVIELLITIIVAMAARAILNSVMRGIANASSPASPRTRQDRDAAKATPADPPKGNELHKDPVCGTYVAESTSYRRQVSGQTFYYCSESCKEKHALVAR